jgi:hypothetical protein
MSCPLNALFNRAKSKTSPAMMRHSENSLFGHLRAHLDEPLKIENIAREPGTRVSVFNENFYGFNSG